MGISVYSEHPGFGASVVIVSRSKTQPEESMA
jgi:hypothetical protein